MSAQALAPEGGLRLLALALALLLLSAEAAQPTWKPTWDMKQSTIFMPCNDSGYLDPAISAQWGVVDFVGRPPPPHHPTPATLTDTRPAAGLEQCQGPMGALETHGLRETPRHTGRPCALAKPRGQSLVRCS